MHISAPSPLAGEGWGGGSARCRCVSLDPTPVARSRPPHGREQGEPPCAAATAATANSGICVSCGTSRVTRRRPKRAPSRSIRCASSAAWSGAGKPGLRRIAALGHQRGEPHHVEAETGIAFVADRRQPIDEQRAHARRIAQRRGGAGCDAVHLAVGAEQRDLHQPRALAAPLQQRPSSCARCSMVPSTSSSRAIGSAKRRSAHKAAAAAAARSARPRGRAPDRGGARNLRRSARRAARAGDRSRRRCASGPTCASAATVSGAMRSAASGSGSRASRVWFGWHDARRSAIARHRPGAAHRVGDRGAG